MKIKLTDDIKLQLRKFYFGEIPVNGFTEWLYANAEIDQVIGYDSWYALLDIDYRKRDSVELAEKLVKELYELYQPDLLIIDQAKSIAEGILSNTLGLHDGCRKLAQLWYSYHPDVEKYIAPDFSGYADELDRLGDTNFYDDTILEEVKNLLEKLSTELR